MKYNWKIAAGFILALGLSACGDDDKLPVPTGVGPKIEGVVINDTLHIAYNAKLDLSAVFGFNYGEGVTPPADQPKLRYELIEPVRYTTKRAGQTVIAEQTVQPFALNGSLLSTLSTYPIPLVNGDREREVQLARVRISAESGVVPPVVLPIVIDKQPGQITAITPFNNSSSGISGFYRHVEGNLYRAAVGRTTAQQAVSLNDFEIAYDNGTVDNYVVSEVSPRLKTKAVDFGSGVVDSTKILKFPGVAADEPLGAAGYLLVYPADADTNDVATLRLDVKIVRMTGVESLPANLLNDGTLARTFNVRAADVTTANHPNRLVSGFLNGVFDDGYKRPYHVQDNAASNVCTVVFSEDLEGQTPQAAVGTNAFRNLRLKAAVWTDPNAAGRTLTFTLAPENHYSDEAWRAAVSTVIYPAQ